MQGHTGAVNTEMGEMGTEVQELTNFLAHGIHSIYIYIYRERERERETVIIMRSRPGHTSLIMTRATEGCISIVCCTVGVKPINQYQNTVKR